MTILEIDAPCLVSLGRGRLHSKKPVRTSQNPVACMGETRINLLQERDVGRPWQAWPPDPRPYQGLVTRLALLAGDIGAVGAGAMAATALVAPPALPFVVACVVGGACVGVNLLLVCGAYRVDELATRPHLARILPAIAGLWAYATLLGQLTAEGAADGAWLAA
jgi:hypothetical protein